MGFDTLGSDAAGSGIDIARAVFTRFSPPPWPSLSLSDCVHLRLVAASLALHDEQYEVAADHYRFVWSVRDYIGDADLVAVAGEGLAKVYTRRCAYGLATEYVDDAIEVCERANRTEMASALCARKGWLLFKLNLCKRALEVLNEAEAGVETTGDWLSLANIKAGKARMERRHGSYTESLDLYDSAIAIYSEFGPRHRNLARAHRNRALVKSLIAAKVEAARRRSGEDAGASERVSWLRDGAAADLVKAAGLYSLHGSTRGRCAVLVTEAVASLNDDDVASAANKAGKAYWLGQRHGDRVMMARARVMQCRVVHATKGRHEPDDSGEISRLPEWPDTALTYLDEAAEYAGSMENLNLRALIFIWRGLTLMTDHFRDLDEAEKCCNAAFKLLDPDSRDDTREQLRRLAGLLLAEGRETGPSRVETQSQASERRDVVPTSAVRTRAVERGTA